MQNNSFSTSQRYLSDFYNGVGRYEAMLSCGVLFCFFLSIGALFSAQDPTISLCALINVAAFSFGSFVFGRLHVEIQKMIGDKGFWLLSILHIRLSALRFAIIPITSLPFEDLIGAHKLPPPLAPTLRS